MPGFVKATAVLAMCFCSSEQLEGRTTFLLVGDGDSHEFTKKYRDAKVAGVPVLHVSLPRTFSQIFRCYLRVQDASASLVTF